LRFRDNRVLRRVEILINVFFENTTKRFSKASFTHIAIVIVEVWNKVFKEFEKFKFLVGFRICVFRGG
jgi:uncharacterized membrane protein YiaA